MEKKKLEFVLNEVLVELFHDILHIEEKCLKKSEINDLSVTEIHILEAIDVEGNKNMSEVAACLNITVGTLTTAINKLIKKGYVERRRIEEDRRMVVVNLTEKGEIAFKIHEKFHKDMIESIIEKLKIDEEEVLVKALSKLTTFFQEKYDMGK